MQEKYFVASNSSEGFCSYYNGAFDANKFSKIFVIKGGSGTGKGFFMREVAKCAEKKGFSVRYIYCSSDSASLDGIIINEPKIAVLDGTSPHVYEPKMLGALESFVNLGDFLNEGMLRGSRKIIENIWNEKQRGFENAYRYLSAYRSVSENIEDLVRPVLKIEKLKKYARRFAQNLEGEQGREENLLVRSIGMRGLSGFDTYFEGADIYYEINDYFDTAHFLMREIYKSMHEKRINLKISNNPIIKDRLDALCAVSSGLTFEIGNGMNDATRIINMKRFVDGFELSKIRAQYRSIARVRDDILHLAISEFEKIRKYHFILEEIYGSAMDFEAKEQFTKEFCDKIFENN